MSDYPSELTVTPLLQAAKARVRVPGSKSLTNRALIVAALAEGHSTLSGALDSDDTRVMVDSLQKLGFEVEHDPEEATIRLKGNGGRIPERRGLPLRRQFRHEPPVPDRPRQPGQRHVSPRRHPPDATTARRRSPDGPEPPGIRRP